MNKIDAIIDRYYNEIFRKEGFFNFSWILFAIYCIADLLFLVGVFFTIFHSFSLGDNTGINFVIEQTPVIGIAYRSLLHSLPQMAFKGFIIFVLFVIFYIVTVVIHKYTYGRLGTKKYRARVEKEWEEVVAKRKKAIIALIKEYNLSVSFVYGRIKDRLDRLPQQPNDFSDTIALSALIISVIALAGDSFLRSYISSKYSVEVQIITMAIIIFEACHFLLGWRMDPGKIEIYNHSAGRWGRNKNRILYIEILELIDDVEDDNSP